MNAEIAQEKGSRFKDLLSSKLTGLKGMIPVKKVRCCSKNIVKGIVDSGGHKVDISIDVPDQITVVRSTSSCSSTSTPKPETFSDETHSSEDARPKKMADETHSSEDARPKITDEERKRRDDILNLQLVLSLAGITASVAIVLSVTSALLGAKHTEISHPGPFKVMGVAGVIVYVTSVIACLFRILRSIKPEYRYSSLLCWVFIGITTLLLFVTFLYGMCSSLK